MPATPPSVRSIGISITMRSRRCKAIQRSTLSSTGIRSSRNPIQVSNRGFNFDIGGRIVDRITPRSHRGAPEGERAKCCPRFRTTVSGAKVYRRNTHRVTRSPDLMGRRTGRESSMLVEWPAWFGEVGRVTDHGREVRESKASSCLLLLFAKGSRATYHSTHCTHTDYATPRLPAVYSSRCHRSSRKR